MTRSAVLTAGALVLAVGSLAACAGNPKPQALPPQTMAPMPPQTPELSNLSEADRSAAGAPETGIAAPAPVVEPVGSVAAPGVEQSTASTARELEPVAPEDDHLTVVLDPGIDPGEQHQSIYAAAQAEKKRRAAVGKSTIVLTNKTLEEYSKGKLTYVEDETGPGEAGQGDRMAPPKSDPPAGLEEPDEDYWRNLVRDLRLAWRQAYEDIEEYELEIARLRRDFYAEDDPFYRDSQIKPAWDRALEDLDQAERTVERSQRKLEQAIDDGRRAGALPGWLREGIELEPVTDGEYDQDRTRDSSVHEPSEPVIVDDQEGDGG